MVRFRFTTAALATLLLALSEATAQARPEAQFIYERGTGAESCASEAELRAVVATRLGYDPFNDKGEGRVHVRVLRERATWKAYVQLRMSPGAKDAEANESVREIVATGNDCAPLASAVALTIAIGIDPRSLLAPLRAEEQSRQRRDVAEPLPTPFEVRERETLSPPPSRPKPAIEFRTSLGSAIALGVAPAPSVGATAAVGFAYDQFSLDGEFRADLPASQMASDGTGVRSSLMTGTIVPCRRIGWFRACALAAFGILRGEGVNVESPERDASFYAAFGARAAFEIPVRPFVLVLRADVLAPTTRITLSVRNHDIWTTPAVNASAGIALGMQFR